MKTLYQLMNTAQIFMIVGAVLIIAGVLWQFFPLGRLPGDISIERENFKFYFPIVTSIVLSIILSLIFWAISRFR